MTATAFDLSALQSNVLNKAPTFLFVTVPSITELAAVTNPENGATVTVGGEYGGVFAFSNANLSARVTADPDKGLYVPPVSDLTGASGAWVRQVVDSRYYVEWWLRGMTTPIQDKFNQALNKAIPPTVAKPRMLFPGRELLVARASHGSVLGASSGPPFAPNPHNGILNGLYLDRSCSIEGVGRQTWLNGQGAALAVVGVRASHCRVEDMRIGNVAGQLYLYEAAAIVAHPSNFVQGSGTGATIEDLEVARCYLLDVDTGVSGTAETDLVLQGTVPVSQSYFQANKLYVHGCEIRYRRQGLEAFPADDSIFDNNITYGLDKGAFEISRVLRCIGGQRVHFSNNDCYGYSDDVNGYFGVVAETSGILHHPPYYEFAADLIVSNNHFKNFTQAINVEACRGDLIITGNSFHNVHDANVHFAVRLNAKSYVDEMGDLTAYENKNIVDRLMIANNVCTGASTFLYNDGTILAGHIHNNLFIGNAATDGGIIQIQNTLDHPLENVHYLKITENTAIMNPAMSASGTMRFSGLRPGNLIIVNDNHLTPSLGGLGIIDLDNGAGATIRMRDKYSNKPLETNVWSTRFNPPKPPLLGTL